jgi:hypothetical protein
MNHHGFDDDAYASFMEAATERYDTLDHAARIDKDAMACNKPRTLNDGSGKSHVVKACCDDCGPKGKLIKFGQKGASTAGDPKKGESDRTKAKRKSFMARHGKNIKKGKSSAAYWAAKTKW